MAKRAPKSTPAPAPKAGAENERPARSRSRRRDVASEMATGQDQAAAASDEFVGVSGGGVEPVQGDTVAEAPGASESAPSTDSVSMSSSPSDEDVRLRAYHRYLERGGGHGMDFEDWLEAERDLKDRG
jgi:hypothetical protein